ncbi:MAG TPA: hypothetical protein VMZ69_05460, partial [Saprospiraceae bacterium]|nr:hypothetical protein [Saprospiraceae bacterium]
MKTVIFILFNLICLNGAFAQVIYILSDGRNVQRLDIESCEYTLVVRAATSFNDISFHPDGTLYGLTSNGGLYEIDTLNGQTNFIRDFTNTAYNSLTSAGDGTLYLTGNPGELWSYDKANNQATNHGNFGFSATGDLTFFKGNLYAAVTNDRIVRIDINTPQNSQVVIDENIQGEIFGIVSYAESCDSIHCYAISSGESEVYLIDFDAKTLELKCNLDIPVGGGASTYEFFGSSPPLVSEANGIMPTCNEHNGSVAVNVSGGTPPLTYSLNGGIFQNQNFFDGLTNGIYTIVISDVNGCTTSSTVVLENTTGPNIQNIITTPCTCGNNNGEITVFASGGSGIIEYSIDNKNFQSTPSFNNLAPGIYSVIVQDSAGCIAASEIEVIALEPVTIDSIVTTSPICDETLGSLSVLVSSSDEVLYTIDGANFLSGYQFDQLLPGSYLLSIIDVNGCID